MVGPLSRLVRSGRRVRSLRLTPWKVFVVWLLAIAYGFYEVSRQTRPTTAVVPTELENSRMMVVLYLEPHRVPGEVNRIGGKYGPENDSHGEDRDPSIFGSCRV